MKNKFIALACILFSFSVAQATQAKWTVLVYINGHNSLDSYGALDINEMEKVGSTSDINIVTQWATYKKSTTNRYLVQKDADSRVVTSAAVQSLPRVDMGDYKSLIDFAKWGITNYPADHYFLVVWNHGGGWDRSKKALRPRDISWDDITGSVITTEQLGVALGDIANFIGRPIDIYASDACLMAMPEVSAEMDKSVQYFIGSEELEPGNGWPYDKIFEAWTKAPAISASEVTKLVTSEYKKSYENGSQGTEEVTLSAFDLSKSKRLYEAMFNLGREIRGLSSEDRTRVLEAADHAQYFENDYYRDLVDVVNNIEKAQIPIGNVFTKEVKDAVSEFVVANETTTTYKTSYGVSVWLPMSSSSFAIREKRYSNLNFNKETDWHSALKSLY